MKKLILCVLAISLLACTPDSKRQETEQKKTTVRNIIFMIGDGMGPTQVYAGMTYNGGALNMLNCDYAGFVKTYSANRYTTDSAAGGTALATGNKTNNGMIGMTPDSTCVYSAMTLAEQAGLSTGFVVTSPVTHATPASFYAHQPSREMYENIALDLEKSGVDVFIGGGRAHFEERTDSINLSERMKTSGYSIVYTEEDLNNITECPVGALLADIDMPKACERGDYLPNAVKKSIELLNRNEKGFFLMVEGSQIDYRCHGNEAIAMAEEVIDFDKAVKIAIDFAKTDGNTLVVVTADHETGGLTLPDGNFEEKKIECKFSTDYHTGTFVPMFAFGPGAEYFTGVVENTYFKNKFIDLLNLK